MGDPHTARFELSYPDPRAARIVARSLRQEVAEIDDDRSQTRLTRDAATIELTVQAADLIALRAAVNTWLSLVGVAEDVTESVHF